MQHQFDNITECKFLQQKKTR